MGKTNMIPSTKSRVEAYFFGNPRAISERILFVKRYERLHEYKALLDDVQEFGNVWRGLTGRFRGVTVSIIVTGIGPSLVGDAMYAVNKPDAICVYSGTCGGLVQGLDIGNYFLADEAVCGDGFSLHFGRQPFSIVPGDHQIIDTISSQLAKSGYQCARGLSFTTSTVVREWDADFWTTVDSSCQIIEMGAAAFYAAALASGKRAAALFWVTDLPTGQKTFLDATTMHDRATKQQRYEAAVALDLNVLLCLE